MKEAEKITPTRFLTFAQVKELTGLSRTSIWKGEKEGTFPRRRLISTNRVAWREDEIREWMATRLPVSPETVQPRHNIPKTKGTKSKSG